MLPLTLSLAHGSFVFGNTSQSRECARNALRATLPQCTVTPAGHGWSHSIAQPALADHLLQGKWPDSNTAVCTTTALPRKAEH